MQFDKSKIYLQNTLTIVDFPNSVTKNTASVRFIEKTVAYSSVMNDFFLCIHNVHSQNWPAASTANLHI